MTGAVARIALGCGNFGGIGAEPRLVGHGLGEAEAFAVMDAAWSLGIRRFDTADAYAGGRSETIVGRWISARGVSALITTKTFFPMGQGAEAGLAPARVERQLESSLRRLGLDQVELYLAHWFDEAVPLERTLAAFEQLLDRRLTRACGVSNFSVDQLRSALDAAPRAISAIENEYSLLRRDDGTRLLPFCAERSLGYIAFSPLCGGWLTGKYRRDKPFAAGSRMDAWPELYGELVSDATFAAIDRLRAFARERNRSTASVALAWVLGEARVTQAVVGASKPEHLEIVAEALRNPLGAGERAEVGEMFA